ncbi:MAG TPA: cysteine--tRNA ligase [bacterium]|nr:cysteine--tRNA ligase [bacterium]
MLEFYNTLTRKKEAFIPIDDNSVRMYTCGPTVYNYAHIGNYRAYIFEDLLRRFLKYKGYEVIQVMNITDVDDKIIRDSTARDIDFRTFTEPYKEAFLEDLQTLRIESAEYYPEATAHIGDMVELVQRLLDRGYAYQTDDESIYYSIDKFPEYGKLSNINPEEMQRAERIAADDYDKESIRDFVLWKAWKPEDKDVYWETPIGKGRPGWHIECSTMSMKYLGERFDIHTGGVDNIFPHHENEIAQSEAATGKQFVNYWLHCEHLIVDGKKMSKSLGNFYTLKDLLDRGYDPVAIRYVLLTTHYRQKLNFTLEKLDEASSAIERLRELVRHLEKITRDTGGDITDILAQTDTEFEAALEDDLNIARALGAVFSLGKELNNRINNQSLSTELARKALEHLRKYDSIFAVLKPADPRASEVPAKIRQLVEEREGARQQCEYATADSLRDRIHEHGYAVEDTPDGPIVKPRQPGNE